MRFEIILAALVALTLPSCQPSKEAAKPPVRLGADVEQLATEMLGSLETPVTIQITRGGEGETQGEEAQALVDLLARVSPNISVTRLDVARRTDMESLGVPRGPVIEMMGKAPGILRYYGYPERKETRPFFEGILSASGRPAALPPAVTTFFSELNERVWIRIFTTPD
ncbi:MAG: hypothetical protein JSV70_05700 [bacterium]|nr:MAG: hypothetical protein JSV70_05700 [bacterium]